MKEPPVTIGHTGIRVVDMEKMIGFYTRVFGLRISDRSEDDRMCFLTADPADHHQLFFVQGGSPDASQSRLAHVAFRLRDLGMLRELYGRLKEEANVRIVRIGTHGNAWTVYFLDPEGNNAEAFVDTPWHVAQPFYEDIDKMLDMSDNELVAYTNKLLDENATRQSFAFWRQDMANKLGMA